MTSLNPLRAGAHFYRHRYLIGQLTRREVLLKYRGSYLGISWSFLYPLLLLATFTFVFGHIFGARWHTRAHATVPLVLVMYCGLAVFNLFSETASAAPRLILSYQSYVKKVIFPTEILPLVLVMSSTVHAAINFLILLIFIALFAKLHVTILLIPAILLPLWLFVLGVAWLLAATGVFVRDLAHVMPVFVQILMFLSPVFYPQSAVPSSLQWFYHINPLGIVIEELRQVALWGVQPDWIKWLAVLAVGSATALGGYAFFRRSQEEFADVL